MKYRVLFDSLGGGGVVGTGRPATFFPTFVHTLQAGGDCIHDTVVPSSNVTHV